ncbi:MAG: hypothetical protein M3161_00760 [Actinomycetota bacterium]|nr:hypothetical protein [Actinomycetota bacterium]
MQPRLFVALVGVAAILFGLTQVDGVTQTRLANGASDTTVAGRTLITGEVRSDTTLPFLVGADKTSLAPSPQSYQPNGESRTDESQPEAHWETDPGKCNLRSEDARVYPTLDPNEPHAGLFPDSALGWPHNPDCIYLGGFGIGPTRASTGVDQEYGIWVRSLAISNGKDTVLFQVVDTVGYFYRYRPDVCDECGIKDMREKIASEVGIPAHNVTIASTHTHGGADTYGGWGGVPKWYWHQMRDSIVASGIRAVDNVQPASLSAGNFDARTFGSERRDFYYSNPDYWSHWLQAANPEGKTIATLINHAAHPTITGSRNTLLHADWPGALNKELETRLGGVALTIEGGLGNMSATGGLANMSTTFADVLTREMGRVSTPVTDNTIKAAERVIEHPVTNWGEFGIAAIGGFDREFTPESEGATGPRPYPDVREESGPVQDVAGSPNEAPGLVRSCVSAGPVGVKTPVTAYNVGGVRFFTGPGELFSTLTEVVKAETRGSVETFVFGNANDALGYIIQSFEFDELTNVATHYGTDAAGSPTAEYEEVFALDRCFGDHVLDAMLDLRGKVR